MKNCPFCSKEISDEAIICKFCHRLLIDENGNDILPETGDEPEQVFDESSASEDKTLVWNKGDLKDLLEKEQNEAAAEEDTETAEDNEDIIEEEDESFEEDNGDDDAGSEETQPVINEDDFPPDGEDVEDDEEDDDFDGGEEYEYEEPVRRPARRAPVNRQYEDEDLAAAADYDPKRTFIVTAVVTLGILLIILVAVIAGYKLFGFGDSGETKESGTLLTQSAAPIAESAADPAVSALPGADPTASADPNAAFVPQVTNDTLSENPEEIVNSTASDPVSDPTTIVTDSNATAPEGTSSSADSQANIVIVRDPDADNSAAPTESTADTQPGDGPAASDDSSAAPQEPAGPGAPAFDPAGSYYSWGEAETLMANYAQSNNLGSNYSYYGGTDGVEMLYAFYDESGNATVYRVDLQTGYVSAY